MELNQLINLTSAGTKSISSKISEISNEITKETQPQNVLEQFSNILNNDESIIILIFATLIFIALSFMKIRLSKWMAIILLFCYFSYIFRILL